MYVRFVLTKDKCGVLRIIYETCLIFYFLFYLKSTNAETLIRCSSLVVGVLSCYCYVGVITEEEAYNAELFQKAKV